jgi:hypothetical protein
MILKLNPILSTYDTSSDLGPTKDRHPGREDTFVPGPLIPAFPTSII